MVDISIFVGQRLMYRFYKKGQLGDKMENNPKKIVPKSLKSKKDWLLSRNEFIKTVAAGGIFTQLPINSLAGKTESYRSNTFTKDQAEIVESVQQILFPSDKNGPGAKEVNAFDYLGWVLSDKQMDQEEVQYIINGIGWVDETSNEVYSSPYLQLTQTEKEKLIEKISQENWGESWLSVILTFIFEALLCDPQYGGNPNGIGWIWLSHNPGQPRPVKDLLYPEILTTVDKL